MLIQEDKVDVAIIIVSYNTCEKTRKCLSSVYRFTEGISFQVIVSDNGSTDGSVEMISECFPQVLLIKNNCNLGFGKANNIGRIYSNSTYVLFLNSDTYLENNAVKCFYDYWENYSDNNLGALGCILTNVSGEYIHSWGNFPTYKYICKRQFITMINNIWKTIAACFKLEFLHTHLSKMVRNQIKFKIVCGKEVDYITGADLFMKNTDAALYNPCYFMYCEETELQYKLTNSKKIIIDTPRIVHDQSFKTDGLRKYSLTDAFTDNSYLQYSYNNLSKHSYVLRILYFLNSLNPHAKIILKSANKISEDANIRYFEIISNQEQE